MARLFRLLALLPWLALVVAGCEAADPGAASLVPGQDSEAVAGEDAADGGLIGEPDAPIPDAGPAEPDADVFVPSTDPHIGEQAGAVPAFELDPSDIFAFPFPTDLRRKADGLDLSGFPNPAAVELLSTYISYAEQELRGFSANGAVYFRFDRPLDPLHLPEPEDSTADDSVVWLIDADSGSATYGERLFVEWELHTDEPATYLPQNLLMVRPVPGLPLREGGVYAMVVRRSARDLDGRVIATPPALALWLQGGSHPDLAAGFDGAFAPLRELVEDGKLNPYEVGVATVYTVDRYTHELERVRGRIHELPVPALTGWKVKKDATDYTLYEGTYVAPNFQQGVKPYDAEGGGIAFDAKGEPIVAEQETLRFALSIPKDPPHDPDEGYPVVLYGHGTGGTYTSFTSGGNLSAAKLLAVRRVAMLSVDQPLHGIRYQGPGDVDLLSFNFLNPDAGRANFRQSAIDFLTLVRIAKQGIVVPADVSVTKEAISLSTTHVAYFGHSHGGLAGVLLGAVESDLDAVVLSGAGAGLAQTLMLRKDPFDILALLEALLGTAPGEVSPLHPVITLVQSIVDVTDPMNYAPHLVAGTLRKSPLDVFVTEGLKDALTPPVTTESLASAAGLTVVAPALQKSTSMVLAGLAEKSLPIASNAATFSGALVTAALYQDSKHGHFLVYDDPKVANLCAHFLFTAVSTGIGSLD